MAFEVGSIQHDHDGVGMFVENEIAGDQLFGRIGGQAIGAGQIDDTQRHVFVPASALDFFDGDAGIVADMVAGAGQQVKDGCLAAVGVAGEGHEKFFFVFCHVTLGC